MSLVRIATVTALGGQRLRLGLTDGTIIEREVGPLLNGPVFKEIPEKPELFAQAQAEGGTVVWPNGADLAQQPTNVLEARNASCPINRPKSVAGAISTILPGVTDATALRWSSFTLTAWLHRREADAVPQSGVRILLRNIAVSVLFLERD